SCRGAKIRFRWCRWGWWKSLGALGPGGRAGVAEFRFAGRGRAAVAELAENSQYQPGFFDARCAGHGREFGGGGIRCAARTDFPGRTAGTGEGAARRGVGSVRANDAAELWKLFFDADCRGWVSTAAG